MPDTLAVHLSRSELHDVEVTDSFETSGTFYVEIHNHGRDAHPHLKLDDDLARVASIEEPNPYVAREDVVRVAVSVTPGADPTTGRLKVETGYGATTTHVEVTVLGPDRREVEVDESLGRPAGATDPDPDAGGDDAGGREGVDVSVPRPSPPAGLVSVGALALVAVAIAVGTVTVLPDPVNPVVVVGAIVVGVGVVVAGVLLVR